MRTFPAVATILLAATGGLWSAPDAGSLISAVKAGNLSGVQKTLQQAGNPNEAERDGTTALHWAVQEDRLDIVQALIKAGANVNAKNHYGLTALAWALNHGDAAMTEQLLKAGANPEDPVPEMGPPLFAAARTGNPEVIKALLKAGAKVNQKESTTGQTALMWAVAEGHVEATKALLAAGADSKLHSERDETPLFFAVRRGDRNITEILLAAGADVNERIGHATDANGREMEDVPGDGMLVVAIYNAHFGLADFLLTRGADANAAGSRWTPLHELSRARNYEESQFPPAVIRPGEMDSLELARHLIAHGANVNAQARTTTIRRNVGDQNYMELIGATPLFLAAKSGDVPYMRVLLAAGADPKISLADHTTTLMVAAGIGCVPGQWIEPERDVLAAVKVLVDELKSDVNALNDAHETPMHGAVCRGADSVIQYLADKGARMNVKDDDGQTPLEMSIDGLNRPGSINGRRALYFHFSDHTIALLRKLTEQQGGIQPAAQTTAQRQGRI
jgi:ankyrin repeat protein